MNYVLAAYYLLETAGALYALTRMARRLLPLPEAPGWMHPLLAVGIFPVLVTWGGIAQLWKTFPTLAPLTGLALAVYGLFLLLRHGPALWTQLRSYLRNADVLQWCLILLSLLLFAGFFIPHLCYFNGGDNNGDDTVRGIAYTTGFMANWLKPAFPTDFSIPISYSYYQYQWSAFLYLSVDGYSWPTIPLLVAVFMSIACFYIVVPRCIAEFLDRPGIGALLVCIITLSVVGPDFILNGKAVGTWPSQLFFGWWDLTSRLMGVANTANWESHYLLGTAYGLAAFVCLKRALAGGSPRFLAMGGIYLCFALTVATLTGVFYCVVAACTAAILAAGRWLRMGTILHAIPVTALAAACILLPQYYTFAGRAVYLSMGPAMLWWTLTPASQSTWMDWVIVISKMLVFMGPLLFIGLASLPFYLFHSRKMPFRIAAVGSMLLGTFVSMTFIRAQSFDWIVRSGQACIIILGTLGVAWLFGECRKHKLLRNAVIPVFILLAVAGSDNFYFESRERYHWCGPASPLAQQLNKTIAPHTAIAKLDGGDNNALAFTGRMTLPIPGVLGNVTVYRHPTYFLRRNFGWKDPPDPCYVSWFGPTVPNARAAFVRKEGKDLKIDYKDCPSK